MTFNDSVKFCFTKGYFSIQGRASRSEYWWFVLYYCCLSFAATIIDAIILSGQGIIPALMLFVCIIPAVTVGIRRLHDLDRSGWWYLICFVPLIGGIVLLFWFVSQGTIGENRFGSDPLDQSSSL